MTRPSLEVIAALRNTADKILASNAYQWGHMGLCNCGFLAQEITKLRKEEIHKRAMDRYGDWTEQLNDYCSSSGLPMDEVISQMIAFGFDREDLARLERLSSPLVLQWLGSASDTLSHNRKTDAVKYLRAWADGLETILIADLQQPAEPDPTGADLRLPNGCPGEATEIKDNLLVHCFD